MPCTHYESDWEREAEINFEHIRELSDFLLYSYKILDTELFKQNFERLTYINRLVTPTLIDELTAELCSILRCASEEEIELLCYRPKVKMSRRLADWWEEHQEKDARRIEEENRLEQRKVNKFKALNKCKEVLSPLEYDLLFGGVFESNNQ